MGIRAIELENDGGYIVVDLEDYEWISSRKWKKRIFNYKTKGIVRVFIEATDRKCFYLHKCFFPECGIKGTVRFKNGNDLDYRKKNIELLDYHLISNPNQLTNRISIKIKNTTYKFSNPNKILGIISNKTVICEKRGREIGCIVCALNCYENRYVHCLDIAAQYNWRGWKMLSGEWCEKLSERVIDLQEGRKRFLNNGEFQETSH